MSSEHVRSVKTSGWRRVAQALWRPPNDPQIFGWLELDASGLLRFQEKQRALGAHVTLTHLVGRAVAHALTVVPELNVTLRRGREKARRDVQLFFITSVKTGSDLTGVKVRDAQHKSAAMIAAEVDSGAHTLRAGKDKSFARSKSLLNHLPFLLLRPLLRLMMWIADDLRLRLPVLGLDAEPFGSAMISSVGMMGLSHGFAPLAWMYRVPLLVTAGELERKPVAVDGDIEVQPILPINAAIDHRYVDGAQIARLVTALKEYIAEPERFDH